MNDHMKENNTAEDGLEAEELALLKEALDAAWPPPKTSLRDGVMSQIRRERAAAKRRALLNRAVKYGSLAACLLLVTAAGFRILPGLASKSAEMAADAYNMAAAPAEEAVMEYADADENGEITKKNMLFSTQSTAAETEAAAEAEEAVPETEQEALPETAAPMLMFAAGPKTEKTEEAAVTECEAETAEETALADDATEILCDHSGVFADSYHDIPEVIIACTGEDVYLAWLDGTEGCDRNIADYLRYMEANSSVLLSDIEMIYDATDLWYRYDWNFSLFGTGDSEAIEEYYKNGGDFAGMVKRDSEYRFKLALLDETGAAMNVDVCAWSIADLVEAENITLSALEEIYEKSAVSAAADYPGYEVQHYDLAALHDYAYSAENDAETPPDAIAPGRHEDEMFRTEPVK